MPARLAEGLRAIYRNQPVANIMLGVDAEAVAGVGCVERTPGLAVGAQRLERLLRPDVAQAVPTALTRAVLEIECLPTVLALEELHGRSWQTEWGLVTITVATAAEGRADHCCEKVEPRALAATKNRRQPWEEVGLPPSGRS